MKRKIFPALLAGAMLISIFGMSTLAAEQQPYSYDKVSAVAEEKATVSGDTKVYEPFTVGGHEVRLLKETTITANEATELYPNAYALIAEAAEDAGLTPSLDSEDFQAFAMTFAFYNSDDSELNQEIIAFVKFIDLYENHRMNMEILQAVSAPSATDSDWADLEMMMPISDPSTIASGETTEEPSTSAARSGIYDTDAAVQYASTWWNKTNNTDYPYYGKYYNQDTSSNKYNELDVGRSGQSNPVRAWNDCTNYVSQCLAAGGVPQIKEGLILPHQKSENWYYDDSKPSHTWGGAPNFYTHWKNRVGIAKNSSVLGVGDVVSMDFNDDGKIDHTAIIVSSGSGDASKLLSAHTTDRYKTSYSGGTIKNWSLKNLFDSGYLVYGFEIDNAF